MALVSYDSILAALDAGNGQSSFFSKNSISTGSSLPWSLWYATGAPGQGSVTGVALNSTQATKSTTGALPIVDAGGGSTLRLVSASGMSSVANQGMLVLVDRLLYYPGLQATTTAPIAMVASATIPRYTTGAGTRIFLEVSTTMTHGTGSVSMSYTNQAGTAGRTTVTTVYGSNQGQGRIQHDYGPFMGLQAGDTGVRSVESVTFSTTSSSGTMAIVICKPLMMLPLFSANAAVERDLVLNTPRFPIIVNDACLQWLIWSGASSSGIINGELAIVAG